MNRKFWTKERIALYRTLRKANPTTPSCYLIMAIIHMEDRVKRLEIE